MYLLNLLLLNYVKKFFCLKLTICKWCKVELYEIIHKALSTCEIWKERKFFVPDLIPCISCSRNLSFSYPQRFHVLSLPLFSFPFLSFSRIHPRSIVCILDTHTLYSKREYRHAYDMLVTSAIGNNSTARAHISSIIISQQNFKII